MNANRDCKCGHSESEVNVTHDPDARPRPLLPWKILKTKELFAATPWIKLSVQQLQLPDGRVVDEYHQITLRDCVLIFASTVDERIIMERQYRHGVGEVTLTLPSGTVEEDEEPLAAAKRELLEETGYTSRTWQSLGSFAMHGNYGCGRAHLFKASDAHRFTEPESGDLEDMEIVSMTLDEISEAVRGGDIVLLGTMATIALATNPLFSFLNPDSNESCESLK